MKKKEPSTAPARYNFDLLGRKPAAGPLNLRRSLDELRQSGITVAETAATGMSSALDAIENKEKCSPDTHCAICMVPLVPEHAHMICPQCHRRDSCCF